MSLMRLIQPRTETELCQQVHVLDSSSFTATSATENHHHVHQMMTHDVTETEDETLGRGPIWRLLLGGDGSMTRMLALITK